MSQRHVLLVDDDAAIRQVATLALERVGGFRVSVAASGADAIAQVDRELPDAVVLDVMMPGMDGPTTLAHLRERVGSATLPVVFLTAKLQPDELQGLRSLGVAGVLAKPFEPMTLAAELSAVLGWQEDG